MTVRPAAPVAILLLIAASAAFAMSSGPSNPPPPPSEPGVPGMNGPGDGRPTPRQEAEQSYSLAYEDVGKAKKDLEDGKAKNAEKKFRRALERCEKAVSFDERYHEAWNLLGFTARKLGDYDKAFKAYDRCLEIKPDYAPAREYLGEAWLEKGNGKQARLQLAWLERLGAAEELKALQAQYDVWAAAHPDSAAAPPALPPATPVTTPAPTDSAAGAGTSGR
jgi:tetratricopeptide (TPR) repeat protein